MSKSHRHCFFLLLACMVDVDRSLVMAQDRPVVFVHGLGSGPGTWADTSARLQSRVRIDPRLPALPWWERFETQAGGLHAAVGDLAGDVVAVGHSNGGLVAREWSTARPVGALVTLGTPHGGALLAERGLDLLHFNYLLYNYAGFTALNFGVGENEFTWIYLAVQAYLSFASSLAVESIAALGSSVGIGLGAPVLPQMVPGSAALSALNSDHNLSREQQAVLRRVGLVFVAHDYWRAGPAVGLRPESRELVWAWMSSSIAVLETAAAIIEQNYPPWNPTALSLVHNLRGLAGLLRDVDPQWCWAVTDDRTCSTSHDGIVATHSQFYPGATNLGFYGPAHLQETSQSEDVLYNVLTAHLQIPTRGGGVEPPPPPCCAPPGSSDTLGPGQRLYPDSQISSSNGVYVLRYQGDGNLVLYRDGGVPIWDSGSVGQSAGYTEMQGDGNFVTYDASGTPVWASGTHVYSGAYLRVQDDGYLVIYDTGGVPLWWVGGS
ncbi:MAG: hypothetical protein ABR606_00920 [Vicinamibacterales bacterium]